MENHQTNYNTKPEPILTQGWEDDNEDEPLISSYFQELISPEPGCIDTLMKPNPNPNLGHPEEDELQGWIGGLDVVHQLNDDGGDGIIVHDQPSSVGSSSSPVNANEPISRSNLCDSSVMVQAARVSDLGPRRDQVLSVSSVDVDSVENKEMSSNRTASRRKRPILWTKEEHSAFLQGIRDGFAGDWKSMSKFYVKTRSSTQIASHAQKFFKRQQKNANHRRRKSINDISIPSYEPQQLQMPPEQAPKTRFSSTVEEQADLPPLFSIRQTAPSSLQGNLPHPNPNPKWVLPVGTHQLPLLPPQPMGDNFGCNTVEDARALCMARQRQSSSSSNHMIPPPPPAPAPVLSRLPQQNPRVNNYSLNNRPPEYFSVEHGWRSGTIEHPQQPQTLASSWPQLHATCRNYGYYSLMPMFFMNPIELALQQSLRLQDDNAVGTPHIPFNVDMGHAHLPNQDSTGDRFYP